MSSSNPNQQYQWPYYAGQPYQQPLPVLQPDYRHSQAFAAPHDQTSVKYTQPPGSAAATFVAELPGSEAVGAPPPVAPLLPTTTPAQQLTEDEMLAQKLQQIEVEEAHMRARSNTNLSQVPSNIGARNNSNNPMSEAYQQEQLTRPHSLSVPSTTPQSSYLPSQTSPSLLPEVVVGPHTVPFPRAVPLEASPSPLPEVVVGSDPAPFPGAMLRQVSPHMVPEVFAPPHPQSQFIPPPPDPAFLSSYLEKHRQVSYPPQWLLPPVSSTLYSSFEFAPKGDFLDPLESQIWRTTRFSKTGRNPPPPAFIFKFKSRGGTFRNPQFSWTMTSPSATGEDARKADWAYTLKLDSHTGIRKSERLTTPRLWRPEILTTYVHAVNYDSLRFNGQDGRSYKWVTHAPLSSTKGARYDTLRHALFVSDHRSGAQDPLYGQIVADHTYWDGFVDTADVHKGISCAGCSAKPINGLRWKCTTCSDHDICEQCRLSSKSMKPTCKFTLVSLPDEALYIRNPEVDVPMVVATLQVLKDWELHMLREQRRKNPTGFQASVEQARMGDMGCMRYWRASDFEGIKKGEEVHGTVMKAIECMRGLNESTHKLVKPAASSANLKKERSAID